MQIMFTTTNNAGRNGIYTMLLLSVRQILCPCTALTVVQKMLEATELIKVIFADKGY
jgi:hypothetical protein